MSYKPINFYRKTAMNYYIKQYLTVAFLVLIAVGINHTSTCFSKPREGLKKFPQGLNPTLSINNTMRGEHLKFTSPYSEEQAFIYYGSIFSPGDMDGDWSGTFGPRYTTYDRAARNDTPDRVISLLENRYQEVKNRSDLSVNLLPFVYPYGDFSINLDGLKWNNFYEVGGIFHENVYGGNPLATAASHGRLEVVKAIVEWIKSKLQALNALDKLPLYLNAPALNFGVGPTKGQLILGTPLIFALLGGHVPVAQYFLDEGVKLEGARVLKGPLSPDGDSNKAVIVRSINGDATDPEELNVKKLILDAHLKLDPKFEAALKKTEADRLQREEQEKIRLEKEHQDRLRKQREDFARTEKYIAEQNALDKKHRLKKLEAALRLPYDNLKLAANKDLLHDAGKAVWSYPEFFETVLIKRPDLADLIENSYSINMPNPFAQSRQKFGTPTIKLQSNVKANNIAAVKTLIEQHPELINQEMYDAEFGQMTPVLYCGNKLELLKYLESKGADIHAQDNILLYYAAGAGSMEVVKYLIEEKGFKPTQAAVEKAKEYEVITPSQSEGLDGCEQSQGLPAKLF